MLISPGKMKTITKILFSFVLGFAVLSLFGAGEIVWTFEDGKLPANASLWDPSGGKNYAVSEQTSPEKAPDGSRALVIAVKDDLATNEPWKAQVLCSGTPAIKAGENCSIRFWIKADADGVAQVMAGLAAAPYSELAKEARQEIQVTAKWSLCSLEFKSSQDWSGKLVLPRIMLKDFAKGAKIYIGKVEFREESGAFAVDMRKAVNFGFADDAAGNGKGGWSDQGADNDFKNFPVTKKWFRNIPFSIINPSSNGGKAIIVFDSPNVRSGVKSCDFELDAVSEKSSYLYIMHTLCFFSGGKENLGKLKITADDGSVTDYELTTGKDIADWWAPKDLENAFVAYQTVNNRAQVGVYVSKYPLPAGKKIKKINLESSGQFCWIVLGMTISTFQPSVVEEPEDKIVADKNWKAVDISDLMVKSGSALDFSSIVPRDPAGTYGRVIINAQGRPAFEKKASESVRFFACPVLPMHALTEKLCKDNADIERFAEAIKRQGYNMVRLHFLDAYLMGQAVIPQKADATYCEDPATIPIVPERLDRIMYFVSCLKARGIYIFLDLGTNTTGYTDAYPWKNNMKPGEYEFGLMTDSHVRRNWRAGSMKLLTTVNPYTGMKLADDPVIAVIVYFNEQNFRFGTGGKDFALDEFLGKGWRNFLKERYVSTEKLSEAWKDVTNLKEKASIEKLPAISSVLWNNGQAGRDLALYMNKVCAETTEFYNKTVKGECGYKGITTQWDFIENQSETPLRAMMPAVTMHGYFAHPTDWMRTGSTIDQSSSLASGSWYTKILSLTRMLDRPFFIIEYGHVFWNRYRHEQGLVFPAYAALQDWDSIALSHLPVELWPYRMTAFNNTGHDPINRASEAISVLSYLRRDTAPAKRTIEFKVTEDDIFRNGNAYGRGFDFGLSMVYAVSKTGISYSGSLPQPSSKIAVKSDVQVSMGSAEFKTGTPASLSLAGLDGNAKAALIVSEMKKRGMLDSSNLSSPEERIFQSDNGEITMKTGMDGFFKLITARLEGTAAVKALPAKLNKLELISTSVPATVAAASLEVKSTLEDCSRILLVYSTDALNTNMRFKSTARTTILDAGELPVLMQTGKLSVAITNRTLTKPSAYVLKFNGERAQEIPVSYENGRIILNFDTASFTAGPSPFIEIVSK